MQCVLAQGLLTAPRIINELWPLWCAHRFHSHIRDHDRREHALDAWRAPWWV